ncbi:MAG TPA: nucleotide exchange factor GrpE [Candidatus Caenarcaniphilales bacterium]|nr:nucleotide exchange factor GrpE [Candidatus Caenarcaniphilales bacterium]
MSDRTERPPANGGDATAGDGEERTRTTTRAEERIAELETSPGSLTREIEALREKLAAAEQEARENRAGWQRATADFMNYRRRTEQDREQNLGLANEALLAKLLVVADDFDRAVAQMPGELRQLSWIEGITAIDRKLRQLLESEGVTPITAAGRPFDPREHEAVVQDERPDVPEGTVTNELQRGYRIRDRVLRPAMVAVAKSPASDGQPGKTN